jgi:hypothetical protein
MRYLGDKKMGRKHKTKNCYLLAKRMVDKMTDKELNELLHDETGEFWNGGNAVLRRFAVTTLTDRFLDDPPEFFLNWNQYIERVC